MDAGTAPDTSARRAAGSCRPGVAPPWREAGCIEAAHRTEDAPEARRWRVRRRRGQTIYQEGEAAPTFYRVERGCVRLLLYAADGRRQIVGFCFPGDLFGFVLGNRDCTAEASTDVELTVFSSAAVLRSTYGRADEVMQLTALPSALPRLRASRAPHPQPARGGSDRRLS